MGQEYAFLLQQAGSEMARGDYRSAMRHALTATAVPKGEERLRCDAFLTLAQASLALNMPVEALGFAVGAQLSACWMHDQEREVRAETVVAMILEQHPHLGADRIDRVRH